jgi:hypothetical protein
MGILNVNDLKVGMILAQSAMNKNGTVILGQGSVVTEKHITSFKTWGVTEVDVEGIDSEQLVREEMEALSKDVVASIERELGELFPPFEGNPVMEEIYKIVQKIRLRQAASRTNGAADETAKY